MSEWWTYALTDFLLFSPRTYYRLFQLYNESVWPLAHVAAFASAIAICLLLWRGTEQATRAILGLLAAIWFWIAWAFHLERYATINWAAVYVAAAFALQALLLLWFAFAARPPVLKIERTSLSRFVLALVVFAIVAQPLIGVALGRGWRQAEVFGLAPDPTAIATLGLLCLATRIPWILLPIPLLWCAATGLTLWTMEAPDAPVAPIAGALALGVAAWKTVRR